jgi:hypothetical protein
MEKEKTTINENINKLKGSLNLLQNKKSKFLFCVPNVQTPSALMYEIYFHADVLSKEGFEVIMLTESEEFTPPDYIEDDLINKTHLSMGSSEVKVGPQDFMIIPESFSNVMEQTKNLPCKRIGFLQSFDYMLNALIPGTGWRDFEISDVITTSEMLKDTLNLYFETNFFNIKTYDIGIPNYFNNDGKPKKPVISIVGRNLNEITKVVKLFYAKYPQYRWVSFDAMLTNSKPPKPLNRIDFANRLKENFAAVWIDRISSFGTFPLECMKSGVIPICLKPDITPDYLIDKKSSKEETVAVNNLGVWTKDYYDLPMLIGDVTTKFLDDSLPEEIYKTMDKVASNYSQENSKKQLLGIYNEFIKEREELFENIINKNKNEKSNDNNTNS